jgi:tetratricopeptide (TPR) repeat protein
MNEKNIAAIEGFKNDGNYEEAVRKILSTIDSSTDDVEKARYLINLIVCTTNLYQREMASDAINQIYKLSLPPDWEPIRNYIAAVSHLDFDQPQEALELLRKNLENPIFMDQEFSSERYENLAQCGFVLTHLERYGEALSSLNEAEQVCPQGELQSEIKLYKATCLGSIGKFDEAFALSKNVVDNGAGEITVRARLKMAQIRLAEARFSEAVDLYRDVGKCLPCSTISASDVERGIEVAMDALMKTPGVSQ